MFAAVSTSISTLGISAGPFNASAWLPRPPISSRLTPPAPRYMPTPLPWSAILAILALFNTFEGSVFLIRLHGGSTDPHVLLCHRCAHGVSQSEVLGQFYNPNTTPKDKERAVVCLHRTGQELH
ncbi:hypothetical protein SCLCIDRAFT_1212932 [Scleroderma citrinum Foug A]|uniref:Uncharacterized protein n=1 Tax=Scleroderma citrinum Foug A TaxID=1036808 RepID=A0A0C3DW87_9AGAM|nr:hypothetical protein SCLCIDRAFT_1212932 [Scleroderma citrinum Foug A]